MIVCPMSIGPFKCARLRLRYFRLLKRGHGHLNLPHGASRVRRVEHLFLSCILCRSLPAYLNCRAGRPQPVLRFGDENHQPSNSARASARVAPPSGAPCGVSALRATSTARLRSRLMRRRAGVKDSTVRANGSSERRLREHRTHVFRWFDAVLQIRRASFFRFTGFSSTA